MRSDTELQSAHGVAAQLSHSRLRLSKTTTAANVRSRLRGAAWVVASFGSGASHQFTSLWQCAAALQASAQRTTAATREFACAYAQAVQTETNPVTSAQQQRTGAVTLGQAATSPHEASLHPTDAPGPRASAARTDPAARGLAPQLLGRRLRRSKHGRRRKKAEAAGHAARLREAELPRATQSRARRWSWWRAWSRWGSRPRGAKGSKRADVR